MLSTAEAAELRNQEDVERNLVQLAETSHGQAREAVEKKLKVTRKIIERLRKG